MTDIICLNYFRIPLPCTLIAYNVRILHIFNINEETKSCIGKQE